MRRILAKDCESEKSMPDECVDPITIPDDGAASIRAVLL